MATDTLSAGTAPPGLAIASTLDGLETLAFALVALTSRAIAEATGKGELTFQQWRILVVLGIEGGTRVTDLAARISASGPSTSRLCQRLARRGFVATYPDGSDGRVTRVVLSEEGVRLRSAIVDRRRALIDQAIGSVARRPFPDEFTAIATALRNAI